MALALVDHNASVLIVASSRDIAAPVLDYLFDQGVAFVFSRPADLAIGGARLKARYRMAVVLDLDIGERIRESAQLLARQLPCVIVSDGPVFRRDDFRAVLHTDTSPIELFTTIQGGLSERSVGKALTGDTPAMGHVGYHKWENKGANARSIGQRYYHYLHHRYFECNYGGDGTVPLDKLFGTWHDGTPESHEVMRGRRKQAHGS